MLRNYLQMAQNFQQMTKIFEDAAQQLGRLNPPAPMQGNKQVDIKLRFRHKRKENFRLTNEQVPIDCLVQDVIDYVVANFPDSCTSSVKIFAKDSMGNDYSLVEQVWRNCSSRELYFTDKANLNYWRGFFVVLFYLLLMLGIIGGIVFGIVCGVLWACRLG